MLHPSNHLPIGSALSCQRALTGMHDSPSACEFKSSQLHSLVLTRISFNDFLLQCDNRDGFEYYTTMQLHHKIIIIRSRFFLLFLSSRE